MSEHGLRLLRRAAPVDDEVLTARVRAGDDDAFAELYRRHREVARRTARCLVPVPSDADDAVSEAFAGMLSALRNGLGPRDNFKTYLMACVRNASRRRRARPPTAIDDELEARAIPFPSALEDPERYVEADTVARAFAGLTTRWQDVLWMSAVEERDPHDIALNLAISDNATAALTMRARDALATAYLDEHVAHAASTGCAAVADYLASYVRGALSASRTTLVEGHVATCSHCARAVEELRDVNKSLRGALVLAPGAGAPVAIAAGATVTTLAMAGASTGLPGGTALVVAGVLGALVVGSIMVVDATDRDNHSAVEPTAALASPAATMLAVPAATMLAVPAPAITDRPPPSSSPPPPPPSSAPAGPVATALGPAATVFSDIPVVIPSPMLRPAGVDLGWLGPLVDDIAEPLTGMAAMVGGTARMIEQMTTETIRAAAASVVTMQWVPAAGLDVIDDVVLTVPSLSMSALDGPTEYGPPADGVVTVAADIVGAIVTTTLVPGPADLVVTPSLPVLPGGGLPGPTAPIAVPGSPSLPTVPVPAAPTIPPMTPPQATLPTIPPVTVPPVTLPSVTIPAVTLPTLPTLPGLGA